MEYYQNRARICPYGGVFRVTWPKLYVRDPLLSQRSLSIERSNFTQNLRPLSTIKLIRSFSPKGACSGWRDQNCKFGTPLLSLCSLKLERSNFTCILWLSSTIKTMQEFAPYGGVPQHLKLIRPSVTELRSFSCQYVTLDCDLDDWPLTLNGCHEFFGMRNITWLICKGLVITTFLESLHFATCVALQWILTSVIHQNR